MMGPRIICTYASKHTQKKENSKHTTTNQNYNYSVHILTKPGNEML